MIVEAQSVRVSGRMAGTHSPGGHAAAPRDQSLAITVT